MIEVGEKEAAEALIAMHGDRAEFEADARATTARQTGDIPGSEAWLRVLAAIHAMRAQPSKLN